MKYRNTFFVVILISLPYLSCQKPVEGITQQEPIAEVQLLKKDKKLTVLTRATQSFGITELEQILYNRQTVAYAFAGGTFSYTQVTPNKIRLRLQRGDEAVTLTCDKKTIIYEEKGLDLLSSTEPQARGISEPLTLDNQTNIAMTIALYNEITSPDLQRITVTQDKLICKRTAISMRLTKSSSVDNLNLFVDGYIRSHPNCSKLHNVDSGCLWGDYGCVSTQQIQCNC